jgi:hypothetical protein
MSKSVTLAEFETKLNLLADNINSVSGSNVTIHRGRGLSMIVPFNGVVSAIEFIIFADNASRRDPHIFITIGEWRPFPDEYVGSM